MRAMSIGVQLCSTEMRSVCAGFWESPVIISPQRDFRTILYFFPSCCFVEFHELESYKAVPRQSNGHFQPLLRTLCTQYLLDTARPSIPDSVFAKDRKRKGKKKKTLLCFFTSAEFILKWSDTIVSQKSC